jgi:hypothetical protein
MYSHMYSIHISTGEPHGSCSPAHSCARHWPDSYSKQVGKALRTFDLDDNDPSRNIS